MAFTVRLAEPQNLGLPLNLWSLPQFMTAVQTLHGGQAFHLQCWKSEKLLAVLPLYEKRLLSYRALISPSTTYYSAVNLYLEANASPARKLLDTVQILQSMAIFIANRYQRLRFNLDPAILDVRGCTWNKLKARPLYTFHHDFQSPLRPLADEKKKAATARAQNYRFAEAFDADAFIRLFTALYQRKHKSLGFSRAAFEQYFTTLHEQNLVKQVNIYRDDRIICSNMLYFQPGDIMYAVFRATEEQEMKWGPSNMLTEELIKYAAPLTHRIDFCGANIPEVARYKAAEGLQLRVFFQIYR